YRQRLPGEVNGAHQVKIRGGVPVLERGLGEDFRGRTTGVGYANVETAEALDGAGHETAYLFVVGHVESARHHLDAGFAANLLGRLEKRRFRARAQRK